MAVCHVLAALSWLFVACDSADEAERLDADAVAAIYAELAQQAIADGKPDSSKTLDEVLNKHSVTEEEWEKMTAFYEERPELFVEVLSTALERLDSLKSLKQYEQENKVK